MQRDKLREDFIYKIRRSCKNYFFSELGLPNWKQRSEWKINGRHGREIIEKVEEHIEFKEKKILDVGSGWGEVVIFANEYGANAWGIEPNRERVEISTLRAKISGVENRFCLAVGENLPFKENTFDVVTCVWVLEHCKRPQELLREIVRVLKKGGYCYLHVPNYLRFWEPHYTIFWIPFLPKSLNRLYLWVRGRKRNFLEHLNFTTPFSVRKYLKELDVNWKDLVVEGVRKKMENPDLISSKRWRFLVRLITFLHLTSLSLKIAKTFAWPVIYWIEKSNAKVDIDE